MNFWRTIRVSKEAYDEVARALKETVGDDDWRYYVRGVIVFGSIGIEIDENL